jgi:MFS family permease
VHLLHHGETLSIIGLTISLHIAGMFALSPVFGILADRVGRVATVLLGQVLLAAALITASFGQESTVAGSTLLTEASSEQRRTRRQGLSDLLMSLVGAIGAILAGVVLGWIGYGGLALLAGIAVVAVVALAPLGRRPATRD